MRPPRLTRLSQNQQNIFSELGQPIPRVLAARAFPNDFKVWISVICDGWLVTDKEYRPMYGAILQYSSSATSVKLFLVEEASFCFWRFLVSEESRRS